MTNIKSQTFGRYQLGDQAGKGGMAVVYKAYDSRLEKQVALKIIRTDRITPEMANKTLKRFEREARSAAQLDHPNIIKVLDYGKAANTPYIVMEFLPGGTLKKRLSKGSVPWHNAINILLPIAQALKFAHERNIVHRDVKPSNILFDQADQPVLSDFGIVKILGDEATQDLSSTGFMIGTPEYMSPEQAMGANFDHRVDIYALGIVFYEMVTGRRPFSADTPVGVLVKQASEPLPRPTRFNKNLPAGVENFLLKALAKDPAHRFQSMDEVINSFTQLVRSNGRKISAHDSTSTFSTRIQEPASSTFSTRIQDPATATITYDKKNASRSWLPWTMGGALAMLLCMMIIGAGLAWGVSSSMQLNDSPTQISQYAPITNITNTSAPTRTQRPTSTNSPVPTRTAPPNNTPTPQPVQLRLCNNNNSDVCVHSINSQPNNALIVALIFKESLKSSFLPYITVGTNKFKCQIVAAYPDRLYCDGTSLSGAMEISVFSSDGKLIGKGTFNIPRYVPPSPTPRKGGGGNYP